MEILKVYLFSWFPFLQVKNVSWRNPYLDYHIFHWARNLRATLTTQITGIQSVGIIPSHASIRINWTEIEWSISMLGALQLFLNWRNTFSYVCNFTYASVKMLLINKLLICLIASRILRTEFTYYRTSSLI